MCIYMNRTYIVVYGMEWNTHRAKYSLCITSTMIIWYRVHMCVYIEVFYKQFAHADSNVYISMTYLRLRKNVEKPNTATNDNAVVFGNADAKTLPSYFCMHMQILRNRHTIALSYFSTYKFCMLGISEYRNSSAEQLLSIVWLSFVPNSCAYTHTQLSTKLLNCNRQKFRRCEKFMMHHIDDDDDDKTTTIHESYDEMMNIISEVGSNKNLIQWLDTDGIFYTVWMCPVVWWQVWIKYILNTPHSHKGTVWMMMRLTDMSRPFTINRKYSSRIICSSGIQRIENIQ